jgi:hypothetical protein
LGILLLNISLLAQDYYSRISQNFEEGCDEGDKAARAKVVTKAVEWMDKNASANEELIRLRAEAAELLGVNERTENTPSSPQRSKDY